MIKKWTKKELSSLNFEALLAIANHHCIYTDNVNSKSHLIKVILNAQPVFPNEILTEDELWTKAELKTLPKSELRDMLTEDYKVVFENGLSKKKLIRLVLTTQKLFIAKAEKAAKRLPPSMTSFPMTVFGYNLEVTFDRSNSAYDDITFTCPGGKWLAGYCLDGVLPILRIFRDEVMPDESGNELPSKWWKKNLSPYNTAKKSCGCRVNTDCDCRLPDK